jgi:hypothetical protein
MMFALPGYSLSWPEFHSATATRRWMPLFSAKQIGFKSSENCSRNFTIQRVCEKAHINRNQFGERCSSAGVSRSSFCPSASLFGMKEFELPLGENAERHRQTRRQRIDENMANMQKSGINI